jgi:phosphatidylglycerol:prolipoprotein diacylglycerol transferase
VGPLVFRAFRVPIRPFADVLAPTVGVALAVTRLGCFLKGCCFGTVCHAPWCVTFPRGTYLFLLHADAGLVPPDAGHTAPVHPLQLYFSAAGLLMAAVSLWLYPRRRYDGQVALVELVVFSATAAALEFFRADPATRVYWGSLPQLAWTALAMTAGSALTLALAEWRHRRIAPVRPRALGVSKPAPRLA